MRDMSNSRATIIVARCYIIRSAPQGMTDAETAGNREKSSRARFQDRPADHGAAGPARPALVVADPVGAARRAPDLARAPRGLRRGIPHGAAGAPVGAAGSRPC